MERGIAYALREARREKFARNLKEKEPGCPMKVAYGSCKKCPKHDRKGCLGPSIQGFWWDHPSMWEGENGLVFVSRPYWLDNRSLESMLRLCKEHGLSVKIKAEESWHFPGHSFCVVIKKQSEEKCNGKKTILRHLYDAYGVIPRALRIAGVSREQC